MKRTVTEHLIARLERVIIERQRLAARGATYVRQLDTIRDMLVDALQACEDDEPTPRLVELRDIIIRCVTIAEEGAP